jgi:Glycosyl hydrolases related to GH101 family, GH129
VRYAINFLLAVSACVCGAASPDANLITMTNRLMVVTVNATNATFSVLDRRTGHYWNQPVTHPDEVVTGVHRHENTLTLDLLDVPSGLALRADLELEPAKPEFTLKLTAKGRLSGPLRFPYAFASHPGDRLIVPINEGISYPVEDKSIEPMRLIAYGGHGICMAFWGVTDERRGYSAIIETPNDAAIRIKRVEGRLVIAPEWDSQRGQFGYARKLRYVFFDKGGHVAIAKRYRKYVERIGLFKTLAEKRRENPNVDLLVGAVNVWNWDADPVQMVKEMQAAGIKHILWSRGGSPEQLRALNKMKVLTSRYDIYQDVMDPADFPFLRGVHPDWPTAAWPKDIILRADGSWMHGWGVRGRNGKWFYCGVLCDSRALGYARKRISADLATHPYRCRFIDTTTASPWRECYSTNHPMTRTDSRKWKMRLLACVSREFKLVTGSETGIDAAVPYVDYFEGMLSLAPYRVPDAGRNLQRIWDRPPQRVAKFQLGQAYRIPLWELVYHDCVVAHWYWGDYNNKLPTLWDKRDLFNVLYGTPPMFMFNARLWKAEEARFVQSYRNTCPFVRAAGYSELLDHRFLTPDRNVQQTAFSNGMTVTVNFGQEPYRLPSGQVVNPLGFAVSGMRHTGTSRR